MRATGYGALAGLAGGVVFTAVIVLVDELPTVARIVGGHDPAVGLLVHLVIAQLIGVSYAVVPPPRFRSGLGTRLGRQLRLLLVGAEQPHTPSTAHRGARPASTHPP